MMRRIAVFVLGLASAALVASSLCERRAIAGSPAPPPGAVNLPPSNRPSVGTFVTCQDTYYDPVDESVRPVPGPHTCSVLVDGVARTCSYAAGQTSCAIYPPTPVIRVLPTTDALTLAGSQMTCVQELSTLTVTCPGEPGSYSFWEGPSSGTAVLVPPGPNKIAQTPTCSFAQARSLQVSHRFKCGPGQGAAVNNSRVVSSPQTLTRYIDVTCSDSYTDPTVDGLVKHFSRARACTFVADGTPGSCTIPDGQTSCTATAILAPHTLAPGPEQVSLPGSQATCVQNGSSGSTPSGCVGSSGACLMDYARSASVVHSFTCDSHNLVSITVNNASPTIKLPSSTPVQVRWTAVPSAGACTVTSTHHSGPPGGGTYVAAPFTGAGSTGTFTTTPLAAADGPFKFTITCVNGVGATATATTQVSF